MPLVEQDVRCACGEWRFAVHVYRGDGVGLATCASGHPSLLLDSANHWNELLVAKRPRAMHCVCGSTTFTIRMGFDAREDGSARGVDVKLTCVACERARLAYHSSLRDADNADLVACPLAPCVDDPWRRIDRSESVCLWRPDDVVEVVRWLATQPSVQMLTAEGYVISQGDSAVMLAPATPDEAIALVRRSIGVGLPGFTVVAARMPIAELVVGQRGELWSRAPVVAISSYGAAQIVLEEAGRYDPHVQYMFRVRFAREVVCDGKVVAQDSALGDELLGWLATRFAQGGRTGYAFATTDELEIDLRWREQTFGAKVAARLRASTRPVASR